MAKYEVNEILREAIKSYRITNKVKAKDLAASINKSPAYISRLENGEIKTIKSDDLFDLINAIEKSSNNDIAFDDILPSLNIKFTNKELQDETWFCNYDTVIRQIPIPSSLVDSYNSKLNALSLSISQLSELINSNQFLTEDQKTNKTTEANLWFPNKSKKNGELSIFIQLPESDLINILEKETKTTSYVFLLAIALYLYKYEQYGNAIVPESEFNRLYTLAREYLSVYKVYSLLERGKLFDVKETPIITATSIEDQKAIRLVQSIISQMQYVIDTDVTIANKCFEQFDENLKWDLGFTLAVLDLSFSELGSIKLESKKELLEEIRRLITKFKSSSILSDPLESYF